MKVFQVWQPIWVVDKYVIEEYENEFVTLFFEDDVHSVLESGWALGVWKSVLEMESGERRIWWNPA